MQNFAENVKNSLRFNFGRSNKSGCITLVLQRNEEIAGVVVILPSGILLVSVITVIPELTIVK